MQATPEPERHQQRAQTTERILGLPECPPGRGYECMDLGWGWETPTRSLADAWILQTAQEPNHIILRSIMTELGPGRLRGYPPPYNALEAGRWYRQEVLE